MKNDDDFIQGLEDDKKRMEQKAQFEEKLDAMGQESEKKAAKAVKEVMDEEERKEKNRIEKELNFLDSVHQKNKAYREELLFLLHDKAQRIQWPMCYEWGVWFDGKGVMFAIRTPDGRRHSRAFKITYQAQFDHYAVNSYIRWAEDLIDLYDNKETTSKQLDIWTPGKPLN